VGIFVSFAPRLRIRDEDAAARLLGNGELRPLRRDWQGGKMPPQFGGAWLEVRDTYPGALNLVYLGYSTTEGRWIVVALDNLMNASRSSAPAWTDGRIAFEGDYLILGMPAHLRQTIERQSEDAFTVVTEELVGARWSRVASRYYRRHPAH
jgi:hypothetical protein